MLRVSSWPVTKYFHALLLSFKTKTVLSCKNKDGLTPESIFRHFNHLSPGDLQTDNFKVLEHKVRQGPDVRVVDEQVLDDRVRARVRPEGLRQEREINGLTLHRQTLSLRVDVAKATCLEVRGSCIVGPRALSRYRLKTICPNE